MGDKIGLATLEEIKKQLATIVIDEKKKIIFVYVPESMADYKMKVIVN